MSRGKKHGQGFGAEAEVAVDRPLVDPIKEVLKKARRRRQGCDVICEEAEDQGGPRLNQGAAHAMLGPRLACLLKSHDRSAKQTEEKSRTNCLLDQVQGSSVDLFFRMHLMAPLLEIGPTRFCFRTYSYALRCTQTFLSRRPRPKGRARPHTHPLSISRFPTPF